MTHGGTPRYLLNWIAVRAVPLAARLQAKGVVQMLLAAIRRFGSAETYRNVCRP